MFYTFYLSLILNKSVINVKKIYKTILVIIFKII